MDNLIACEICKADFADEPNEPDQFLACGHRYHKYCLDTYCSVSGVSIAEMACPLCNKSANDLLDQEAGLLSSGPAGSSIDPIAVETDGSPEPDSPAPKAKAKGRGKGKGRTNSNGKGKGA